MKDMKLFLSYSITKDLNNHKYANCKVRIYNNGVIDLISYDTLVLRCIPSHSFKELHNNADKYSLISFENGGSGDYVIICSGTYSQTTRRQISWFMNEYFTASYKDVKYSYENDCALLTYRR